MTTNKLLNFIRDIRVFPIISSLLFATSTLAIAAEKHTLEAEAAELIGGASKVTDSTASGGNLASLTRPGEGIKLTNLSAASKLAIRYASVEAGTISVAINDQPVRKVNVHSSGALTGSFLHAIIDLAIPAQAELTIGLADDDIAVNIDQIMVGDGDLGLPPDIWNLPPLKVADGPYTADWKAISRIYDVPEWWRDAKFGAWAHWDPQSMPEQGDWYARGMYMQGNRQYSYHVEHFGHPSEYGYKDICHNWAIDRWDPNALMDLYVEMGARYFMAMGVHHDNFDCWDSAYQPWNSVNVGPKVDVVGTWEKAARQHGLRFGIGFHNSPGRTWGQFMPVRYTGDRTGPKQGVPYDALQTILDGKGKWWEGMDPVDLYGPVHNNKDPLLSPFANQFMWRVDDAITKYHPDVIYFDEHAGNSQIDLGVRMGLGFLAPLLIANYYNKSLKWNNGKMDVVINLKGVGGRYNSFQNSPELLPLVDRSLVKSTEAIIEPEIMAYSFQTETTIADWHYRTGQRYMDAKKLIGLLMENVCRNGTMLLNLTQHGRGDLDPEVVRICKDIGAWLKVNGEAVYASRPFEVYGEDSIRYTRNHGNVYATLLDWPGGPITLKALRAGGATLGRVSKVELLGSDLALTFVQDDQGLMVTPSGAPQPLPGIDNEQLASRSRVLRITHAKGWFNDDDPGATYRGWIRRCNLGTGDFNNDLTTSDTPGDVWSCAFTGTGVAVVAPKEAGAGKIEIWIDGETRATADLSTPGGRQAQQTVYELAGLTPGKHTVDIVNRGPGPVAVDAVRSLDTHGKTKTFIDYFLPTPPHGELSKDAWGAPNILPRDPTNGLEDKTIKHYCYWDGQIIKAPDGKYHLFASRWDESRGHNGWFGSVAIHAVSDSLMGPYIDKGLCWPNDARGRGHNVTALTMPGGRYAVVISETRPTEVYVSESLDGPWEHLGTITVEGEPQWHGSNVSIMARPDGNFEFTQRDGRIMFSDQGILGPYKAQGRSVWPKGIPDLEDPCIWYSGGLYHILVNSWSTRKAYHLTSRDGVHDWTNRGVAYDPRESIVRYPDGTVNRWNKLERPSVYIVDGHVVALTFAAIDVEKDEDKGGDGHGSKVIVVPFDGAALDRDLQTLANASKK